VIPPTSPLLSCIELHIWSFPFVTSSTAKEKRKGRGKNASYQPHFPLHN